MHIGSEKSALYNYLNINRNNELMVDSNTLITDVAAKKPTLFTI